MPRRVASIVVVALAIGGCGLPSSRSGYPVGDPVPCGRIDCRPFFAQAITWLDRTEPGHPAVVGAEAYRPAYRDANDRPIEIVADAVIVVLGLEDASSRARHVACESGKGETRCFDASFEEIIGSGQEK